MYFRFFQVHPDSELMDKLIALCDKRIEVDNVLRRFMRKYKLSALHPHGGRWPYLADVDPKKLNAVDTELWAKTAPRRGQYFFRPNEKTKKGWELLEEMRKLPESVDIQAILKEIGLLPRMPVLGTGDRWYSSHLVYFNRGKRLAFIRVPWRDAENAKEAAKIAKYRTAKRRNYMSGEHEHLSWTPPGSITEVKEWEYLKAVDEAGGE